MKYTIESTENGYSIAAAGFTFEVEGGHNDLEDLYAQAERVWGEMRLAWSEQTMDRIHRSKARDRSKPRKYYIIEHPTRGILADLDPARLAGGRFTASSPRSAGPERIAQYGTAKGAHLARLKLSKAVAERCKVLMVTDPWTEFSIVKPEEVGLTE